MTFVIPARQNQFIQENIFNNGPVRRIAVAMNTNCAFTGSFTENPFWYQQFALRQIRILRGGQPIVDFVAADNCRFYVTKMKAMNFQDDIPSIPNDNLKDHYVLVFDLTSMQDATENFHYPQLVGEPRRISFTFSLEHITELIVLESECLRLQLTVWLLLERLSKIDKVSLHQHIKRIPHHQHHQHSQVSVPWFISLWLWSNYPQWSFCPYKYATKQYVGGALDNKYQFSSQMLVCRFSCPIQVCQGAVQADDARATTILSQRLWFLHDICSFSSFQFPTRRNYWSSQC